MKIPPEDLTSHQLLTAYKELDTAHQKLQTETAEKIAALDAEHRAAESQSAKKYAILEAKHLALEAEHAKFKMLHLKHPEVVVADFDYDASLGLYKLKNHPERGYFCGSCVPQGTAAQVRKANHSFVCNVCGKGIADPDDQSPPTRNWGGRTPIHGRMDDR
jgi:hypothetical protein